MSIRDYFRGKRIAVIGLGTHGEMVEDVEYLIKAGSLVSVYDLRSEARIRERLDRIRELGLANHVTGTIPAEDLLDMDLIILSSEYPKESSFLAEPLARGIPVEYAETLFFKLSPPVTMVGIAGTAGKSTVASMLSPMLKAAAKAYREQGFFEIDPESDGATLGHLRKIKSGDIVLVRLTPLLSRELYRLRMSPHVAVLTTIPPEGSYTDAPFDLLSFQTYNNFIVAPDTVIDATRSHGFQPKAKMLRTKASIIPPDWPFLGRRNPHDMDNAALAVQAARLFKVSDDEACASLAKWKPLRGRLEPLKKLKRLEIYNDSASVSACSTEAALRTLGQGASGPNIVLMLGGAATPGSYRGLASLLPRFAHTLILLPGSGTLRERTILAGLENVEAISAPSLEEAARMAVEKARPGDRILFSPAFEAGGMESSRTERSERFVRALRSL